MKFLDRAIDVAKTMPKKIWIAAIVVPGVLAVMGLYIAGKTAYNSMKNKEKK